MRALRAAQAMEGYVCLHTWQGGHLHGYCTIVVCYELRMAPRAWTVSSLPVLGKGKQFPRVI